MVGMMHAQEKCIGREEWTDYTPGGMAWWWEPPPGSSHGTSHLVSGYNTKPSEPVPLTFECE
jgi:hypothetical protein